jgi:hypothetical protein
MLQLRYLSGREELLNMPWQAENLIDDPTIRNLARLPSSASRLSKRTCTEDEPYLHRTITA